MFQRRTHEYNMYSYILNFVRPERSYKIIYWVAINGRWSGFDKHPVQYQSYTFTNTFEFSSTSLRSCSITWHKCSVDDTCINTWPVLTKNTEFKMRLYNNIPVVLYRFWPSFLVRSCVMVSGAEQDVDRNESKGIFLFSVTTKEGRGLTSRSWYYIIFYCIEVLELWITGIRIRLRHGGTYRK